MAQFVQRLFRAMRALGSKALCGPCFGCSTFAVRFPPVAWPGCKFTGFRFSDSAEASLQNEVSVCAACKTDKCRTGILSNVTFCCMSLCEGMHHVRAGLLVFAHALPLASYKKLSSSEEPNKMKVVSRAPAPAAVPQVKPQSRD